MIEVRNRQPSSFQKLIAGNLGLALCLSSMFVVYPHLAKSSASTFLLDFFFTLSIAFSLGRHSLLRPWLRISYVAIGLLAAISTWLHLLLPSIEIAVFLLYGVFFGVSVLIHLRELFQESEVQSDTLLGAVCTYILIGLFFSSAYAVLMQFDPNCVSIPQDGTDPRFQLIYFSFVTLTTVGYGDILPTSNATKMLCAYEAILGQVFVAVIVGLLVGKHKSARQPSA